MLFLPFEFDERHIIRSVFETLLNLYGKQKWWPGDTPFEVAVGAILVQRTSWYNATKAIHNLKDSNSLDAQKIATMSSKELSKIIQPSGLADQKAERLIAFSKVLKNFGGTLDRFLHSLDARKELLNIKGIGNETADSILLYAGNRRFLPIGNYTIRTLVRIGLYDRSYREWNIIISETLPPRIDVYKEFHALFVAHCKQLCKKRPRCTLCPLWPMCKYASTQRSRSANIS